MCHPDQGLQPAWRDCCASAWAEFNFVSFSGLPQCAARSSHVGFSRSISPHFLFAAPALQLPLSANRVLDPGMLFVVHQPMHLVVAGEAAQILRVGVEECARLDCWSPRCIALATCWRGCKRSSGVPRIDVGARLSATSVSCVTRWTTGPSTPRPPTRKRMRVGGRCGRDDTFSGTTALRNTGPSAPGALVCALTTVSAGSRRSCRPTCFRERLRGSRSPYRALCTCHIR